MTTDELARRILDLPVNDLIDLLNKLESAGKRTLYLVVEAEIDDLSERGKIRPTVTAPDSSGEHRSIDVFEEIAKTPAFLHDPVMIEVLKRWLGIIKARHLVPEEIYKAAQSHIERISRALIEGAKSQEIPKKHLLYVNINSEEMVYIGRVIALLRTPEVRGTRSWKAKCDYFRKYFTEEIQSQAPQPQPERLDAYNELLHVLYNGKARELYQCIDLVLKFVMSSHRPQRTNENAWLNHYLAWRNGLDPKTIKAYKSDIKKNKEQPVFNGLAIQLQKEYNDFGRVTTDIKELLYPSRLMLKIPYIKKV